MNTPLPPLPLKNGILEVDNGFIESLVSCPRALLYSRLLKRTLACDKPALNFGKAMHLALEARYTRHKNNPPTLLEEQDIYEQVIAPHFAQFPNPEEDHRNASYLFEIFQRYNQRFAHEQFNLLQDTETGEVATEVSFSIPFGKFECVNPVSSKYEDISVHYVGRIDLPVLWDNQLLVGDFKTSSMLGPKFFDGQKVSSQYEGYAWALEQTLKRPCEGFFIRAIRTNAKPMKPREGWDKWWDESLMTHKEYLRPGQLNEWHRNTKELLHQFFWHYSRWMFPQHKKACTMYGKCQFYDVCYLPAEQRSMLLASEEFMDNTWSPLN